MRSKSAWRPCARSSLSYETLFDLPIKRRRIEELAELSNSPDFWSDNRKARALTTEKSNLETEVKEFEGLERGLADAETLFELSQEAKDQDALKETSELITTLTGQF